MERFLHKAGLETFLPMRVSDVQGKANLSRTAEKLHDRAYFD